MIHDVKLLQVQLISSSRAGKLARISKDVLTIYMVLEKRGNEEDARGRRLFVLLRSTDSDNVICDSHLGCYT